MFNRRVSSKVQLKQARLQLRVFLGLTQSKGEWGGSTQEYGSPLGRGYELLLAHSSSPLF